MRLAAFPSHNFVVIDAVLMRSARVLIRGQGTGRVELRGENNRAFPSAEQAMNDLLIVGISLAFFVLAAAYVRFCDTLR